jgi:hypothetical protein
LANYGIGSFIKFDNKGNVIKLSEQQSKEFKEQARKVYENIGLYAL